MNSKKRVSHAVAAGQRERSFTVRGIRVRCMTDVLLAAVALNLVGLLLPLFLTEGSLRILDGMATALMEDSASRLFSASLRLVLLNVLRSSPFYIGMLLLTQAFFFTPEHYLISALKYLLSFLTLIGFYRLVNLIYGIKYVVRWPALLVLVLATRIRLLPVRMTNKVVVIFLLLVSVQGMDVMPGMEPLGFGQGEIAMEIKRAALVLQCNDLLSVFSILLFFSFMISALMLAMLSNEKQQLQNAITARNRMEKMLVETQLKTAAMRCDREMQSLVHDLKSPLTTIQGLSSLTSAITDDPAIREYQQRLSDAAERMGRMISEILYEDKHEEIDVGTFIRRTLAHFSSNAHAELVRTEVLCPDCIISVNVIRMIRAVINVLDNACNALEGREGGEVVLRCEEDGDGVKLCVRDNGRGISRNELEKIWQVGYSGMVSTGLGLAFVKQVVEGHDGSIDITSMEGAYTLVTIRLARSGGKKDG